MPQPERVCCRKQFQLGLFVSKAALFKQLVPDIFGVGQNRRHEFAPFNVDLRKLDLAPLATLLSPDLGLLRLLHELPRIPPEQTDDQGNQQDSDSAAHHRPGPNTPSILHIFALPPTAPLHLNPLCLYSKPRFHLASFPEQVGHTRWPKLDCFDKSTAKPAIHARSKTLRRLAENRASIVGKRQRSMPYLAEL